MPDSVKNRTSPDLAVIVLAAGAGTRMKSALPKPLHRVAGLPMIEYVFRAAEALGPAQIVVVTSPELRDILRSDNAHQYFTIVVQDPPRGTGDAVLAGLRAIEGADSVLIVYADHPLISSEELYSLIAEYRQHHALAGIMTCVVDDAAGYGRIERDSTNTPVAIVERISDDPVRRLGPTEINSGIMMLRREWAAEELQALPPNPLKNEIFLTDLIEKAAAATDRQCPVVAVPGSMESLIGVNDRAELAIADDHMRRRIRAAHMRNGVTIVGPETVFIDDGVAIGGDTTIYPNSILHAGTSIGERCTVGPNSTLDRAEIGHDSLIEYSVIRDSSIGSSCHVGPFSHLRNGTVVDDHVHIGNFVEAKNARFATGVRAGHMSYLGDTNIGKNSNIGAGTVTCNFDGVDKHRTEIGANVFIGSDSMLVAPLTIGDGAATGAGSVVTRNVEPGAKVVGVPARPIRRRNARGNGPRPGEGE
jgi:bifunctional UDP-N-acetylglucosamine pyrophosphorylase/glucosamine-1-phosphate N-acetyltransferase